MSTDRIIHAMTKLNKLHRSLNELAIQKSDIVKAGDMEALNRMLQEEQKHVKAIETVEKERVVAATEFLESKGQHSIEPTVSNCLLYMDESTQHLLEVLKNQLLDEISSLKEWNELNQQLIYQSLQFVNVTLDMLRPQPVQNLNYERPQHMKANSNGFKGSFDSKA
ncbi:flagellar protein FlgN [Peribacillus alkalitolerans]|uniref:flagellar protein FlgN n=1 Tax=Peribacillus alkalitolerans TaxID=1550385 RepID=UPI0013D6F0BE|nr:flagellar protein FlgN [Peribacillus alkalitolerans]